MYSYQLTFTGDKTNSGKVECVKAMRSIFNTTLADAAKLVGDAINDGSVVFNSNITRYVDDIRLPYGYKVELCSEAPSPDNPYPLVTVNDLIDLHIRACKNLQLDVATLTLDIINKLDKR
jgi:hypothetical protein